MTPGAPQRAGRRLRLSRFRARSVLTLARRRSNRHGELWEELSASRAAAEAAQRQVRPCRASTQRREARLTRPPRGADLRLRRRGAHAPGAPGGPPGGAGRGGAAHRGVHGRRGPARGARGARSAGGARGGAAGGPESRHRRRLCVGTRRARRSRRGRRRRGPARSCCGGGGVGAACAGWTAGGRGCHARLRRGTRRKAAGARPSAVLEAVAHALTGFATRACLSQRDLRAANAQLTARIDELAATSARAQRDAAEAREQVAQARYFGTAHAHFVYGGADFAAAAGGGSGRRNAYERTGRRDWAHRLRLRSIRAAAAWDSAGRRACGRTRPELSGKPGRGVSAPQRHAGQRDAAAAGWTAAAQHSCCEFAAAASRFLTGPRKINVFRHRITRPESVTPRSARHCSQPARFATSARRAPGAAAAASPPFPRLRAAAAAAAAPR